MYAKAKEASQFQQDKVAENEKIRKGESTTIWTTLIAGSLVGMALAVSGGLILSRNIATPLARAASHFEEIAKGDISRDAPAEFRARADEIGTLARAMQKMTVAMRKMIQEISGRNPGACRPPPRN